MSESNWGPWTPPGELIIVLLAMTIFWLILSPGRRYGMQARGGGSHGGMPGPGSPVQDGRDPPGPLDCPSPMGCG